MLRQITSFAKKNIWFTVAAAFILGAGGIAAAVSKGKEYGNKATSMVGGAQ
ncbi:hypothetical protein [Halarcobacter ebronensis]|uniref:hypothetical protein n=1 Tax=Halarcobacter ebronensis TaxID=1462615 RepID=UPI0013E95E80|nr:hypothetical protein [Halarcobacter ebronensis]QKF82050.1 hypothetical protein AEBR_1567 [Halarcobacter ebronensis]